MVVGDLGSLGLSVKRDSNRPGVDFRPRQEACNVESQMPSSSGKLPQSRAANCLAVQQFGFCPTRWVADDYGAEAPRIQRTVKGPPL